MSQASTHECDNKGVYCTLVLSDSYVPGALLLQHQLRELDPLHEIVCIAVNAEDANTAVNMPVSSQLSARSIDQLRSAFDKVYFVDPVDAGDSPEFRLLDRPELRLATTKLRLWSLPYSRVVYLDADTLPLQSINDLFDVELPSSRHLAASPDCGWPDLFNSGVLVLRPDETLATELIRAIPDSSYIDGTDQGLLNEEFAWVRLPFLYNVTINASYEYLPAYNRFKDDIKVLHFIGKQKPWLPNADQSSEGVQRWWSAYNRAWPSGDANAPLNPSGSAPWLATAAVYNEENIIPAPAGYWDARNHAPFKDSRPEGEFMADKIASMKLAEEEDSADPNVEDRSSRPQTLHRQKSSHTFPVYGQSLVTFPFEHDPQRGPPERDF